MATPYFSYPQEYYLEAPNKSVGSLPVTRDLYARYEADNYNTSNKIWYDSGPNARNQTVTSGTPTVVSGAGNGSIGKGFNVVQFGTGDTCPLTSAMITGYTLFHVCRFTGTPTGRIISGYYISAAVNNPNNIGNPDSLFGFYSGLSGVSYLNGSWITQLSVSTHGANWVISTNSPFDYRSNGVSRTTNQYAGFNYLQPIAVNSRTYAVSGTSTEQSNCQVAEVIIYNTQLTLDEIKAVEAYLEGRYGIPLQNSQYAFNNTYLYPSTITGFGNAGSAQGGFQSGDFRNPLNVPSGVTSDSSGTIYIANTSANQILRIDNSTNITNIVSSAVTNPWDMAVTKDNSTLYTTDTNGSIWRSTASASYSTDANLIMYYSFATSKQSGSTLTADTWTFTGTGNATLTGATISAPNLQIDPTSPFNTGTLVLNSQSTTSGQYLAIPAFTTPAPGSTGGLTFSVWVKWNALTSGAPRIFDFGNGTTNNNILIYINSPTITYAIINGTGGQSTIVDTLNITNSWVHVVWTITSGAGSGATESTWTTYYNGIQGQQTGSKFFPNSVSRTNNYLGKSNWSNDNYTTANMNDFRMYNKVLSATEVQELYQRSPLSITTSIYSSLGTTNKMFIAGDSLNNMFFTDGANSSTLNTFSKASDTTKTALTPSGISPTTFVAGGIAIDPFNNVYISDTTNQRILKKTPANVWSVIPSIPALYYTALAMDRSFNLYSVVKSSVSSTASVTNRIVKIDTGGYNTVEYIAGEGTARNSVTQNYSTYVATQDYIDPTTITLTDTQKILLDASGNLLIADRYNHRIRKMYLQNPGFNVKSLALTSTTGSNTGSPLTGNQFITLPAFTSTSNGITFAFWMRTPSASLWSRVMDFGNGITGLNSLFVFINGGQLGVAVGNSNTSNRGDTSIYTICPVGDNIWRHFVIVFTTDNTLTCYVNGVLRTMRSSGLNNDQANYRYYPNATTRYSNYLGKSNYRPDPFFTGSIKGFAMYQSALSKYDAIALYNPAGLIMQYSFNQETLTDTGAMSEVGGNATLAYTSDETANLLTRFSFNAGTYDGSTVNPDYGSVTGTMYNAGGATTTGLIPKFADTTYYPIVGTSHLNLTGSSATAGQYVGLSPFATGSNGLTISFWYRANGAYNWQRVFDFGNGSDNDNIIFTPSPDVSTTTVQFIVLNGSAITSNNPGWSTTDNTWRHVTWVMTYAAPDSATSTWSIYYNGGFSATVPNMYYPKPITRSNNYIGKSNWASNKYYNGGIAEFRMYNTTLTAGQIQNLFYYNRINLPSITGTLVPPVNSSYNYFNGSLALSSATNQYLTLPSFSCPSNGLSFAFWFNSASSSSGAGIFDFGNGSVYGIVSGFDNISAVILNNNLQLIVYISSTAYSVIPVTAVNSSTWNHIVWTIATNGTWTVYQNGVLIGTYSQVYPNTLKRITNYIGYSCVNNVSFNGYLSDFRVYNYVLSAPNAYSAFQNISFTALSGFQMSGTDLTTLSPNRANTADGKVITIMNNGKGSGYSGDGGSALNAQLRFPRGLVVDNAGNIYITDLDNNRIRKISDVSGGLITTLIGNQQGSVSPNGSIVSQSTTIRSPYGIAIDGNNDLIFIEGNGSGTLRKISLLTGILTSVNTTSFAGGSCIAIDNSNNIYVSSSDGYIRRVDGRTNILTTVTPASYNTGSYCQLICDSLGNVFYTNLANHYVNKIDVNTGAITHVAGKYGTASTTGDGDFATQATLNAPWGITCDLSDNIYIAEFTGHVIRVISPKTGIIRTLIGQGGSGLNVGENTIASNSYLFNPTALYYHKPTNSLYVLEDSGSRVKKIFLNNTDLYENDSNNTLTGQIVSATPVVGNSFTSNTLTAGGYTWNASSSTWDATASASSNAFKAFNGSTASYWTPASGTYDISSGLYIGTANTTNVTGDTLTYFPTDISFANLSGYTNSATNTPDTGILGIAAATNLVFYMSHQAGQIYYAQRTNPNVVTSIYTGLSPATFGDALAIDVVNITSTTIRGILARSTAGNLYLFTGSQLSSAPYTYTTVTSPTAILTSYGKQSYSGVKLTSNGDRLVVSTFGGYLFYSDWNATASNFTVLNTISYNPNRSYPGVCISLDGTRIAYCVESNGAQTIAYWSVWNAPTIASGRTYINEQPISNILSSSPIASGGTSGRRVRFTPDMSGVYLSTAGGTSYGDFHYALWNGTTYGTFTKINTSQLYTPNSYSKVVLPTTADNWGFDVASNGTIYWIPWNTNQLFTMNCGNPALTVSGEWLQVQLPDALRLKSYTFMMDASASVTSLTGDPMAWFMLGSNNGSNWTVVDRTVNNTVPIGSQPRYFVADSVNYYSYYRWIPFQMTPLNCILHYKFDGDVLNYARGTGVSAGSIVNGGTATTCSVNTTTYKVGSGSLYSSGTNNNYFGLPALPANVNGYSFSFWYNPSFYVNSLTTGGTLFSLNASAGSTPRIYIVQRPSGLLTMAVTSTYFDFYTPPLNTWVHITWTLTTGSVSTVYINGGQACGGITYTSTNVSYFTSAFTSSAIGGDPNGFTSYPGCNGFIDDFRYFDGILSPANVASLFVNPTVSNKVVPNTSQLNLNGLYQTANLINIYNNSYGRDGFQVAGNSIDNTLLPREGYNKPTPTQFKYKITGVTDTYDLGNLAEPTVVQAVPVPGATFTGNTLTVGSNVWTASASTSTSSPYLAFNSPANNANFWASNDSTYSTSTGFYTGNVITNYVGQNLVAVPTSGTTWTASPSTGYWIGLAVTNDKIFYVSYTTGYVSWALITTPTVLNNIGPPSGSSGSCLAITMADDGNFGFIPFNASFCYQLIWTGSTYVYFKLTNWGSASFQLGHMTPCLTPNYISGFVPTTDNTKSLGAYTDARTVSLISGYMGSVNMTNPGTPATVYPSTSFTATALQADWIMASNSVEGYTKMVYMTIKISGGQAYITATGSRYANTVATYNTANINAAWSAATGGNINTVQTSLTVTSGTGGYGVFGLFLAYTDQTNASNRAIVATSDGYLYYSTFTNGVFSALTQVSFVSGRNYCGLCITIDGSRIAYTRDTGAQPNIWWQTWNGTNYTGETALAGGNAFSGRNVRISNDMNTLYVHYTNSTGIYYSTWNGTNYTQPLLINNTFYNSSTGTTFSSAASADGWPLDISPDGKTLYSARYATTTFIALDLNLTSIRGEWLQMQLPDSLNLTSYSFQNRLCNGNADRTLNREPLSWVVVGSNDGTSWVIVDNQTSNSPLLPAVNRVFTTNNGFYYRYFRIIFRVMSATSFSTIMNLCNWTLNGVYQTLIMNTPPAKVEKLLGNGADFTFATTSINNKTYTVTVSSTNGQGYYGFANHNSSLIAGGPYNSSTWHSGTPAYNLYGFYNGDATTYFRTEFYGSAPVLPNTGFSFTRNAPPAGNWLGLAVSNDKIVFCNWGNGFIYWMYRSAGSSGATGLTFTQTLQTTTVQPYNVALSADGSIGAVASYVNGCYFFTWNQSVGNYSALTKLSTSIAQNNFFAVGIATNTNRLVACTGDGAIGFADWNPSTLSYGSLIQVTAVGSRGYQGVCISADGDRIACCVDSGYCYWLKWNGSAYIDERQIGRNRSHRKIKFTKDKNVLFVTCIGNTTYYMVYDSTSQTYINPTDFAFLRNTISSSVTLNSGDTHGFDITPCGRYLYHATINDNTMYCVEIGVASGEYIQAELSTPAKVSGYIIYPRADTNPFNNAIGGLDTGWTQRIPRKLYVLGSNDNIAWFLIHAGEFCNSPTATSRILITNGEYSDMYFRYVRLVVGSLGSSNNALYVNTGFDIYGTFLQ